MARKSNRQYLEVKLLEDEKIDAEAQIWYSRRGTNDGEEEKICRFFFPGVERYLESEQGIGRFGEELCRIWLLGQHYCSSSLVSALHAVLPNGFLPVVACGFTAAHGFSPPPPSSTPPRRVAGHSGGLRRTAKELREERFAEQPRDFAPGRASRLGELHVGERHHAEEHTHVGEWHHAGSRLAPGNGIMQGSRLAPGNGLAPGRGWAELPSHFVMG
ncbi:hypothetical protein Droror1_Dr00014959 [Drosera rotundifolia]